MTKLYTGEKLNFSGIKVNKIGNSYDLEDFKSSANILTFLNRLTVS